MDAYTRMSDRGDRVSFKNQIDPMFLEMMQERELALRELNPEAIFGKLLESIGNNNKIDRGLAFFIM